MKTFLLIVIIATLSVSVAASAQTRRVLVIGIGQQEDKSWEKINGDKDGPYVEEMQVGEKSILRIKARQIDLE